jgi:acyl carrier protein
MNTAEEIRKFITTNFYVADPAKLADDASFLDQGIIDSTGVLEVVTFLEDKFGIVVGDSEMLPENLDSVKNLTVFVERKRSKPATGAAG